MLIEKSGLSRQSLQDSVILVTGAGGGIGLEAALALAWLGGHVVIAEIDAERGSAACDRINAECGAGRASFFEIDLADAARIKQMHGDLMARHGHVDAIINNATIAPIGPVDELDIEAWDQSYAVNLRAPVLLARLFLPDMKRRGLGTLVFVPSSGAAPFMGAYEVFKTAQVELCNTLAAELEGSGLSVFAIGPGLVPTDTARRAIKQIIGHMGISEAEFYRMNASHMLDAEAAGTGFAVSVVQAARYNGQEIGSIQALLDAGIRLEDTPQAVTVEAPAGIGATPTVADTAPAVARPSGPDVNERLAAVQRTYCAQHEGWLARSLFERQWVLRDFRKTVGLSVDQFRDSLLALSPDGRFDAARATECCQLLLRLKTYYAHQYTLLQGYEKNPDRLRAHGLAIQGWIEDVDAVLDCL